MGEYVPLYISIVLTLILGIVVPATISTFVDVSGGDSEYSNTDAFNNSAVYNSSNVDPQAINSGREGMSGIISSLDAYTNAFQHVPTFILAPLLIIIASGYAYTIIRMVTLA